MGCGYPSTGDVSYRSDETVEVVDFAWTPSHIKHNEEVTVVDALRAERITFWRTEHEDLFVVDTLDRLALLVGNSQLPGWRAQDVKKVLYKDLTPGETWSFIIEDHFDYRTLSDATFWIQNTEAQNIYAKVTERVVIDGRIDEFILFEGNLVGKSIEPFELNQPVTLPYRIVFHEVTLTNQETEEDAFIITLIGGWVGHSTYLPADLPCVYGEGLQSHSRLQP